MQACRLIGIVAGTLAVLATMATSAVAQQNGPRQGGQPGFGRGPGGPGGPGFGFGGPGGVAQIGMLLGRPDVQRDLGLTTDQKTALEPLIRMGGFGRGQRGQGGQPGGPPPGGGRGQNQPPSRVDRGQGGPPQGGPPGGGQFGQPGQRPDFAAMEKARKEQDDKIRAVLTPAQNNRLEEIRIQIAGAMAVFDANVQKKLGITDAQKEELSKVMPQRGPGGRGEFGGPPPGQSGLGGSPPGGEPGQGGVGGPPPGDRGQGGPPPGGGFGGRGQVRDFQAQRKEMEAKIYAILTDQQRATLKAMGGKTFVQDQPQQRGG